MKLILVPVSLDEANAFVAQWHRHHQPVPGAKFCIGVFDEKTTAICGVAIVGRPIARMLDDGWTLEDAPGKGAMNKKSLCEWNDKFYEKLCDSAPAKMSPTSWDGNAKGAVEHTGMPLHLAQRIQRMALDIHT